MSVFLVGKKERGGKKAHILNAGLYLYQNQTWLSTSDFSAYGSVLADRLK